MAREQVRSRKAYEKQGKGGIKMAEYNKDELLGLYDLGPDLWEEYRDLELDSPEDEWLVFQTVEAAIEHKKFIRNRKHRKREIEEMALVKALADIDPREEEYSPEDPTLPKFLVFTCMWYVKKFGVYLRHESNE